MTDDFELEMQSATQALAQADDDAPTTRRHARKRRVETRRAKAEANLSAIWPERLENGTSYHFISGGDVDALSYLRLVVRDHALEYLLFSTWCMAMSDVIELETWLADGTIGRIDAYCGEIFPSQYGEEHAVLADIVRPAGGRCAIFRNHAKLFVGFGPELAFAVESSANINTNPRTEQTAVHIDRGLATFYKDFYDGIQSYNRDFDDWQPVANHALGLAP